MVELATLVDLLNFSLVGVLIILTYNTFSRLRESEFAQPLLVFGAGFYAHFSYLFFRILARDLDFPIPGAQELTEALFVVLVIVGMLRFTQLIPLYRREGERVISAIKEIEGEAKAEQLRERRRQLDSEVKQLKVRYLKREIDAETYFKLLADREGKLTEVKARLSEMNGSAR
jgi:hypothetical protein